MQLPGDCGEQVQFRTRARRKHPNGCVQNKTGSEMKLKVKHQTFQTQSVKSVIDCFDGQPNQSSTNYRIDPGLVLKEVGVLYKR